MLRLIDLSQKEIITPQGVLTTHILQSHQQSKDLQEVKSKDAVASWLVAITSSGFGARH